MFASRKLTRISWIDQVQQRQGFLILGILALALLLRLWNLGGESVWIDEAYSIDLARHGFAAVIQGTAADQHPPLYYLLLHIWLWFGSGVAFARLLSVLTGVAHIGLVISLGKRLGGQWLGLGGGLLLAISPMHIWYSQEIRMYILLAAFTTAATIALWDCLQGKNRWFLYGLFTVLSLYTQYFAAFVLLAHGLLVLAWVWRQHRPRFLLPYAATLLLSGLAFSVWIPTAINQTRFHTMTWIQPPRAGEVVDTLLRLLLGSGILVLPVILRWLALAALLALAWWAVRRLLSQHPSQPWAFAYLAAWAWIPFLAISGVSLGYPIFQFKQFIIVLTPLLLWAVWTARLLPRWPGLLFLAGILALNGAASLYQQVVVTKDDWRGAAIYIQEHARPGDVVYGNPAASKAALDLYWQSPLPFLGYPPGYDIVQGGWDEPIITEQIAGQELRAAFQNHPRLWLVEFSPEFRDPNQEIPAWLQQHARLLDERSFGRLHVRLYARLQEGQP